ncbi:hypothetical protein ACFSTA_02780 [Ornithinibacillus salinisoli]|uniref:Uncharacterized protein n=2 Tax=Ornithinibacillus salinisoli TaxID=1848459 RepID=A0ABW4VVV4_9BACI
MVRIKFQTVVHSSNESPNGDEKITGNHVAVTAHFPSTTNDSITWKKQQSLRKLP